MKTRNTNQIINIYKRNFSDSSIRKVTVKFRNLIEEVKFYVSDGWNKSDAISFILDNEFNFLFTQNNEEKEILRNWMKSNLK